MKTDKNNVKITWKEILILAAIATLLVCADSLLETFLDYCYGI